VTRNSTTEVTTMPTPTELAERYVALRNEPDPERRRAIIQQLWTEGGAQILRPPQEFREQAAALGFFAAVLEARGHGALERRVATAYEEFVAPGVAAFRSRGTPVQLGDVLRFEWEYAPLDGGAATGGGTEFVLISPDGRIRTDYQFIDG
jgi:hypothetical protein